MLLSLRSSPKNPYPFPIVIALALIPAFARSGSAVNAPIISTGTKEVLFSFDTATGAITAVLPRRFEKESQPRYS